MIKYKRIQMPSKGIEARPIQGKQVSTKEIATEIEKVIGIPAIRTMSVLSAFVEMAYNHFETASRSYWRVLAPSRPDWQSTEERSSLKKST